MTHCRLQDTLRPNGTTNSPRVIKSSTTTNVELVLHSGRGTHTGFQFEENNFFFPLCSFYRFGNRLCIVSKFWLSLLVRLLLSTIYYRSSGWPSQLNRTAPPHRREESRRYPCKILFSRFRGFSIDDSQRIDR